MPSSQFGCLKMERVDPDTPRALMLYYCCHTSQTTALKQHSSKVCRYLWQWQQIIVWYFWEKESWPDWFWHNHSTHDVEDDVDMFCRAVHYHSWSALGQLSACSKEEAGRKYATIIIRSLVLGQASRPQFSHISALPRTKTQADLHCLAWSLLLWSCLLWSCLLWLL